MKPFDIFQRYKLFPLKCQPSNVRGKYKPKRLEINCK